MSSTGEQAGPADWTRLDAGLLRADLTAISGLPGTPVNTGPMALEACGHAAANSFWVSYSVAAADAVNAPAGIAAPTGEWAARCQAEAVPALTLADVDPAETLARPWRRRARSGIYDEHRVSGDARSADRTAF
jgi:hypothetical protein